MASCRDLGREHALHVAATDPASFSTTWFYPYRCAPSTRSFRRALWRSQRRAARGSHRKSMNATGIDQGSVTHDHAHRDRRPERPGSHVLFFGEPDSNTTPFTITVKLSRAKTRRPCRVLPEASRDRMTDFAIARQSVRTPPLPFRQRFVEQQYMWIGRQGHRDFDLALFSVRQRFSPLIAATG